MVGREHEGLTPPTPGRSSAFRQQRVKDTAPEIALRRALTKRGLRYRLHRRLLQGSIRTADIVFPGQKVVVDVRGCFWHACPEHGRRGTVNGDWWDRKLEANARRDRDTEERLADQGWRVIVVWEHEDADEAASRIAIVVTARKKA